SGSNQPGVHDFSLQIGGDKDTTTHTVDLSPKIYFTDVRRINAFGGDDSGGTGHNPEVTNTGIDTLDVTPYADNTPQGWGIETYWNEGDPVEDGDLLIVNGVSGVSDNITVQPSGQEAGQVSDINAATGTPIAVINYVLNTNIIVNGNDGSAGDLDSLTLNGLRTSNGDTGFNDNFIADFTAAGGPGTEVVKATSVVNN